MWGKIWGVGEGKRKCAGVKRCGRVYGVSVESVGRGEGRGFGGVRKGVGVYGEVKKNMGSV